MINPRLRLDNHAIADFCRRWRVRELAVFGSAVTPAFRQDSDVDFLVSFEAGETWDLLDFLEMQHELERIVGRAVDLIERDQVERSANPFWRSGMLSRAESIYAQG